MKIAIDGRLYGLENAGLGRYAINLIDHLAKLDSENEYYLLLRNSYYKKLSLPRNWKQISADYPHYGISEQLRLPKILKDLNPDLVHFLHFNVPLRYQDKFVVTIHDLLMHRQKGLNSTTLPLPLYHLKRLGYKKVFANAVQKSEKIIVPSHVVEKEIFTEYQQQQAKIKVIYEGVSTSAAKVEDSKKLFAQLGIDSPYFIYVGNAYPHKNLPRLIEAIVELNRNIDIKVQLLIVTARNVFAERLSHEVNSENGDLVRISSFLPDNILWFLYKNALGFVFPSLSEGFGLPGLEAMKAGTLAIVSDIPIFKEIYAKNALYFNPYDFGSIEKAMREVLYLDLAKRRELILNAKEFVIKYSWENNARETLNVYNSVLPQKRR